MRIGSRAVFFPRACCLVTAVASASARPCCRCWRSASLFAVVEGAAAECGAEEEVVTPSSLTVAARQFAEGLAWIGGGGLVGKPQSDLPHRRRALYDGEDNPARLGGADPRRS